MKAKIIPIGTSLGIRLPATFLKMLELRMGDYVELSVKNKKIFIEIDVEKAQLNFRSNKRDSDR